MLTFCSVLGSVSRLAVSIVKTCLAAGANGPEQQDLPEEGIRGGCVLIVFKKIWQNLKVQDC